MIAKLEDLGGIVEGIICFKGWVLAFIFYFNYIVFLEVNLVDFIAYYWSYALES